MIKIRSSRPEVFYKKSVSEKFTKYTGKHLCLSLFSIRRLQELQVEKLKKLKNFIEKFNTKKTKQRKQKILKNTQQIILTYT